MVHDDLGAYLEGEKKYKMGAREIAQWLRAFFFSGGRSRFVSQHPHIASQVSIPVIGIQHPLLT